MERRRFLRVLGGGGFALGVGGCASALPLTMPAEGGTIRLILAEHPVLSEPGGSVRLRTGSDGRLVYVLALGNGELAALSPICTHQGCTVEVQGAYLVCPCHGSTYARDGVVVRGPAPLPLRRFPVREAPGGVLLIETGES